MKRIAWLNALLVCIALTDRCSAQAYSWYQNPSNGHFYTLTQAPGTWLQAEAEAVTLGGHLCTIRNMAEQSWIIFTLLPSRPQSENFWIGCTDHQVEGTWTWISGEPFAYTQWAQGEPNSAGGGEDCGELTGVASWDWNDRSCSTVQQGIIELTQPTILEHPQSISTCAGNSAVFSVSVAGGPAAFQWRRDGTLIPGETAQSLLLPSVTWQDAGTYDVIVTIGFTTLTSNPARLTVADAYSYGTGLPGTVCVPLLVS